jgi:molecular chaperone Hsp33
MTAALLLAQVFGKAAGAQVALRLRGAGPLRGVMAEAGLDGGARGYAYAPEADLPPRPDGKLDVAGLIGGPQHLGTLEVMRLMGSGEPYTGSVELVSGEIAEDVAYYLGQSEQIASAVLLGVLVGAEGVRQAGGVLVQVMPGASESVLAQLEAQVNTLGPFTARLASQGILGVLEHLFTGLEYQQVAEPLPVRFQCRCSRERARDSLRFFGLSERQEMMDDGGQEVVCDWCGEKYTISIAEILALDENNSEQRDERVLS